MKIAYQAHMVQVDKSGVSYVFHPFHLAEEMDYVRNLKDNPIARKVKLADLRHNSEPGRLENPTEKDRRRTEKYKRAIQILSE